MIPLGPLQYVGKYWLAVQGKNRVSALMRGQLTYLLNGRRVNKSLLKIRIQMHQLLKHFNSTPRRVVLVWAGPLLLSSSVGSNPFSSIQKDRALSKPVEKDKGNEAINPPTCFGQPRTSAMANTCLCLHYLLFPAALSAASSSAPYAYFGYSVGHSKISSNLDLTRTAKAS